MSIREMTPYSSLYLINKDITMVSQILELSKMVFFLFIFGVLLVFFLYIYIIFTIFKNTIIDNFWCFSFFDYFLMHQLILFFYI